MCERGHVRFSISSSAGTKTGDVWKWASIIGSQTPWGNNERIYRLQHLSCPWTCYLQICRLITRWNTTWLEVLMIPAHTGHIFLTPLSHVNTWRKHKLRHAQLYITVCSVVPGKPKGLFCLQASNHVNDTLLSYRPFLNRSQRQRPKYSDKAQNLCLCTSDGDERDVRFNL